MPFVWGAAPEPGRAGGVARLEQCPGVVPQKPKDEQHSALLGHTTFPIDPLPQVPGTPLVVGPEGAFTGARTAQCSGLVPQKPYWEQHSEGSGQMPLPVEAPPHVPATDDPLGGDS